MEDSFKQQLRATQSELQSTQNELQTAKQQIEKLNMKIAGFTKTKEDKKTYDAEMIAEIREKVRTDPEWIKKMVKTKRIGINDQIEDGQTLLNLSSAFGSYEVATYFSSH